MQPVPKPIVVDTPSLVIFDLETTSTGEILQAHF
jgi:hypothetical protein